MQQIGNAIGESLARYGQNKAENEFLQTRLESLAPYLNTVAQSGNIMDKNSAESKLLGDIEKFSSMSIPQKKATLLNAEFFLDRADKQRAREMQDIQAEAARFNLQTAQGAEARRLGLEQAISQVAQLPTQQEICNAAASSTASSSRPDFWWNAFRWSRAVCCRTRSQHHAHSGWHQPLAVHAFRTSSGSPACRYRSHPTA